MKYARIITQAIIAKALEAVMIVALSVSRMKAIETATRKTPKYRLALLRRNWVNSVRISLRYLFSKMIIDVKVRNTTMKVYVISAQ